MTALLLLPFSDIRSAYPAVVLNYWRIGFGIAVATIALGLIFRADIAGRIVEPVERAVGRLRPRTFAIVTLVATIGVVCLVQSLVLNRRATTSDEFAQLWHAQIMASGRLSLPPDPNPEFFAIDNVIDHGRWYSHFPVGGPLALLPGVMLGVPWLVGPVLAGLSALLLYGFARVAFGEATGRATTLLFILSPMVVLLSATYMNHIPALFFTLGAFAAAVAWERAKRRWFRVALAATVGLCLGAIATIRPLDAVVVATAVGVAQLAVLTRLRPRLAEISVEVAAAVAATGVLLLANASTNGGPFTFGYDVMWGAGHRVGFHADPQGGAHTLARALEYAVTYVAELNYMLAAWPLPAMVAVVAGVAWLRRGSRWEAAMLALLVGQLVAYAAYWGRGELFGPRFLFTAIPAAIFFVARVPFAVRQRYGPRAANLVAGAFGVCALIAWTLPGIPASALGLARQASGQRSAIRYDAALAVRESGIGEGLVFIREPASQRLLRRMWGQGVSRANAASLLASRDGCDLYAAVERHEQLAPTTDSTGAAAALGADSHALELDAGVRVRADPQFRLASADTISSVCAIEIDRPGFIPLSFGAALPLEPIGADGRVGKGVVYVADLGAHNEVLRSRFGDRAWYRLVASSSASGRLSVKLAPY